MKWEMVMGRRSGEVCWDDEVGEGARIMKWERVLG
jgi:hypothetical protein